MDSSDFCFFATKPEANFDFEVPKSDGQLMQEEETMTEHIVSNVIGISPNFSAPQKRISE